VEYPLTPARPDKQFKRAQELRVSHTARLENDDYVRVRDLKSREEVVAGVADAANHLGSVATRPGRFAQPGSAPRA
jgi:hypothetical protein